MTLASQIESDVDNVFHNTDDFAVSVSQWPLGVSANAVTATVVFIPDGPTRDKEAGEATSTMGTVYAPDSLTLNVRDRWQIESEMWEVIQLHKEEGGMVPVEVQRVEDHSRRRARRSRD